jgi:hypothetical protein
MISNEELVLMVNRRFEEFAKNHPEDLSDIRGFIRNQIRLRAKRGMEITDTKLENIIKNERQRIAKQNRFDEAPQPTSPKSPFYSLMIDAIEAEAPAHLKGLARGLSGLKDEE